MNRILVNSSQLLSAGYDALNNTLEIEFHGGEIYQYHNVPQHMYDALLNASSKSTYFNEYIKDAYRFDKVFA